MPVRAFWLGLATVLAIGSTAAAAEADTRGEREPAAVTQVPAERPARRWLAVPHLRLGIPDSGFRALEAERHLFGFYLRFDFGGAGKGRSARPLR